MTNKFYYLLFFISSSFLAFSQDMQEGYTYLETAKYQQAEIFFNNILEKYPDNKTARLCYGRAIGLNGKSEEAKFIFTILLEDYPSDFEVKLNYGEALLWNSNFLKAKTFFKGLVEEDPNSFPALLGYANSLSNLKKYESALLYVNKALVVLPGNSSALDFKKYMYLGYAYQKQQAEQYEEAEALLKENLILFKDDEETLLNLVNLNLISDQLDNISNTNTLLEEQSTDKIKFLLEGGFWKIKRLVKEESEDFKPEQRTVEDLNIKGINYYPQVSPWDMFGDAFLKSTISNDFKIIKDNGLNSIRLFVQYDDFGKADVDKEKLEKLRLTLDAAEENGLNVIVTLFDFYGNYSVKNWTLNMQHVKIIVSEFKDHKAIIAWDIKNEPNLDFDSRGKVNVISWLNNMIDYIKSLAPNHSVTIGWSNVQSASILKDKVDFVSFHYYDGLENLDLRIKNLKNDVGEKPIVLQEFGISSYNGIWKPFGSSEEHQANYHKKAQEIIAANNIHFISWTLYDFEIMPKKVVGSLPWRKNVQKRFGFIDRNGTKKAAFKFISH